MESAIANYSPPRRQSSLGWISLGMALSMGGLNLALLMAAFFSSSGSDLKNKSETLLFFLNFTLAAPAFHAIGLALGVIGLFLKKSLKTCSILGICFNIIFGLVLWLFTAFVFMPTGPR